VGADNGWALNSDSQRVQFVIVITSNFHEVAQSSWRSWLRMKSAEKLGLGWSGDGGMVFGCACKRGGNLMVDEVRSVWPS